MRRARHGVERTAARGGVSSLPSHGVGWGIEPAAAWGSKPPPVILRNDPSNDFRVLLAASHPSGEKSGDGRRLSFRR